MHTLLDNVCTDGGNAHPLWVVGEQVYVNPIRKPLFKSFNNILKANYLMCTHPIIMRNPAKNRYGGMEYIKVPCRNCAECARSMQSDYTCRAIALWNSLPPFYYAYFCTLTFRNEDLPKTHVYVLSDDGTYYKTITKVKVPCFNHQLYRRFRKNFSEFVKDNSGWPVYILTTCEYGEKKHRPHYHCIIFVPFYADWKEFKMDLERYWHYGFTMDKRVACVDGQSYQRNFHNAIEYVTKYVCKYNQWLPFYLKSDKYVTDFAPYDVKPRVFTSNHFGSVLESILTELNYEQNNVYLAVKDDRQNKGRSYSLPAYYRRRKHITTQIISQYVDKRYWYDYMCNRLNDGLAVLPYLKEVLHRPKVFRKSVTFRSEKYCQYLFNDFKKNLRKRLFNYDYLIKNNSDFRLFILEKFASCDLDSKSLYNKICNIYLERHVLPLNSLSSSLSLPYNEHVENISKTHYLLLKGLNVRLMRLWFYEQLRWERDFGLPFHDSTALPAIYFRTLKAVPYSVMPDDWYKIEYMDNYMRKYRIKQIELREQNEYEWYLIHTVPYRNIA